MIKNSLTGIGEWEYHDGDTEHWEGEYIIVKATACDGRFLVSIQYKDSMKHDDNLVLESNFYQTWREFCVRNFCKRLQEQEED